MHNSNYRTRGGIVVHRQVHHIPYPGDTAALADRLDQQRGALLSSGFEFPGRYTRWDCGFVDPPLVLIARDRAFSVEALNARGELLIETIAARLRKLDAIATLQIQSARIDGTVHEPTDRFPEEMRSRQPTVFSVLRAIIDLFASTEDRHLGLYGAFGYDLVFQFEPMPLRLPRAPDQRDLVLFLPDELLVVDHMRQVAIECRYDFAIGGARSTGGLPRATAPAPFVPARSRRSSSPCGSGQGEGSNKESEGSNKQSSRLAIGSNDPTPAPADSDHMPGEYAAMVQRAREAFARGDLFEVVLGQLFAAPCAEPPSVIFRRLRQTNPAPYGALMNLGDGEFLVAASPEMYVRVEGRRIETCPISGTIRRGADALEDAERIRELLNSAKDEAELTMCTDVDRNDKSRVCEAGSVRVIGRRQIELYSRLIHTVDHVEGTVRSEFDALDGFLSHAWAVTVTGAPKRWAIRFIEAEEKSARRWYGGAIGAVTFDGNMNTGLTLRTIRMQDGIAEVRAGATLLHDSNPREEEAETRLKAAAMLAAIAVPTSPPPAAPVRAKSSPRSRVLLVDHEDSFVHTLAGYLRAAGAEVTTLRPDLARDQLAARMPADLIVLSAGPGRPDDFAMRETLALADRSGLSVFGVCLGLQGMVEYFGGTLDLLSAPMHGKPSQIRVLGGRLFAGLPRQFTVGRYHSIYARRTTMPRELIVTAETEDGVVMAIEHATRPIAAVQFHPESVLTPARFGHRLIESALATLTRPTVSSFAQG